MFEKVMRIVREPGGKQLVIVIGPTGIGKSFLLEWIVSVLEYEWSLIQQTDPGRIPVASMEVPAKDTKQPSWGDFYIRALEALAEVQIEKKIYYADVAVDVKSIDGSRRVVVEDATIRKYRRAVESCFKNRKPGIFLLDEAQQLINTGGLRVDEQVENIKSLANMTKTLLGLFGTYKLLDLLGLDDDEESDQVIRRGAILHFRRYLNYPEDMEVFCNTITSFQVNMPFKKPPDLTKHSNYLYERTLGCIGILRDWLVAAYTEAVNENAKTLELKHLKATCLISKARSVKMADQFAKSENDLADILDSDEEEYQAIIDNARRRAGDKTKYTPKKDERTGSPSAKSQKRSRKRPGRQNPKRRPIGENGDH
jgi:hypothetical protein